MTMQTAAWGRLGQAPRPIETNSGKAMAVATIAVDIADPRNGEDEPPLWLGIVAFGPQADALVRHAKGDCVSVSGRLQRHRFQGRDGTEREQLQVIADAIVSARTVRPGGRKSGKREAAATAQAPLEDEVPEWVR